MAAQQREWQWEREPQGLGSFGAESFSHSVFTWLGNSALLCFLSEMFASAGAKASERGLVVPAVSGPRGLCNVSLVHMEGIGICSFPRKCPKKAAFGLDC